MSLWASFAVLLGVWSLGLSFVKGINRRLKDHFPGLRLSGPLYLLDTVIALNFGVQSAPEQFRAHLLATHTLKVALIISVFWLVDRLMLSFVYNHRWMQRLNPGTRSLLKTGIRVAVFSLGALIILDTLGISISPILASLGIGSIAIALALQDTLGNSFSAIYLLLDEPLRVGDNVRVAGVAEGVEGIVRQIGWRSTRIELGSGNTAIIPNSKLSSTLVINYEFPTPTSFLTIPFLVKSNQSVSQMEVIALDVGEKIQKQISGAVLEYVPIVRFTGVSIHGLEVSAIIKIKTNADGSLVKHEFLKELCKRYLEAGILFAEPSALITQK